MNIRYLILPLTTRCNLACAYCYTGGTTEPAEMTEGLLEAALKQVDTGRGRFHLQITGGEPTLVPERVEAAVRGARECRRPCTIGIQTNGTRLTRKLVSVFNEWEVQVGVSLDGPPQVQEMLRGRAAETLRGLQLLESMGVPFRVTAVVCAASVGHLHELALLLAGFQQVRGIGLDLLVNRGRAAGIKTVAPADPAALETGVRDLVAILDDVNRRRRLPIRLRERDRLRSTASAPGTVPFCHACRSESAAVHPDGRLYPCGQTLGDPHFAAGTVFQPEWDRLTRLNSQTPLLHCGDCPLTGRCPGECPSRLYYNRSGGPGLACVLYRTLWSPGTHA